MSPKPNITDAIIKLTNQPFGWDGGEDRIVWPDTNTGDAPTQSAINAKLAELISDWDALAYSRSRQAEYPDWGSQLNKIYDDGIAKWKSEMVDPVKAKYPKPE